MDERNPEDAVLVAGNADEIGEYSVPGSVIVFCQRCGAKAWVAPSLQPMLPKVKEVICTRCFVAHVEAHPDEEHEIAVTRAQAREIIAEEDRLRNRGWN